MIRKLKIVILVAVLLLGSASVGFWYWRQAVLAKRSTLSSAAIEAALVAKDYVTARSALAGLNDPAQRTEKETLVRTAELENAISIRDISVIRMTVNDSSAASLDPKLLESADLKLARDALQNRDLKAYESFPAKWKTNSAFAGQWLLMEADALLAKKLPEEALTFLRAATLSGPDDAQRYIRIALLEAKEPWKAMASLDQGLKSDPRNADILSFRAQIQEAAGRTADARLDYVAAVLSERKNPLYRDMLASFYLRTGDLSAAAETWRDAAEDTSLGVYALKSWFWSTVSGSRLSKPLPASRQEGWQELVLAISQLPDGIFWNASIERGASSLRGSASRPEIIWMKLLGDLRTRDFSAARKRIETGFSKEAENLNPGLALKILAHLTARENQDPHLSLAGRELPSTDKAAHPFVYQFARWANRSLAPEETQSFEAWLAQPAALVAILYTAEWSGAAVTIGEGSKLTFSDGPDWFDYGYAKSIQRRDGKEATRAWLESLPKRSPAAELILGEILLTSGATDQGLAILQKIASSPSELASRAAWTLALTELDRGQPAKARDVLQQAPSLATTQQGQEISARIALAEGKRDETLRIYQELGEASADAMIFMSKEAFSKGDYDQALKWTGILARRFPDQPSFRKNILKIEEAKALKKP